MNTRGYASNVMSCAPFTRIGGSWGRFGKRSQNPEGRRETPGEQGRRWGGVLLEVVIALALFVGAAGFTLGAMRTVINATDRAGRDALAADFAQSKLAELQAGLISLADLRDGASALEEVGSISPAASFEAGNAGRKWPWTLEVRTARTEFTGLTLVEITVTEQRAGDEPGASATLRGLVKLSESGDEAYEEDDLLRGLPAAGGLR